MIADKILLVTREGWLSLSAGEFSEIPSLPKLKGPTLVVTDFDEAPVGVLRFEGKPAYAAALVEKYVRAQGLTEGAAHIVLHRVNSVPGGCLALYTAVSLESWQRMQQWAEQQTDHCIVVVLASFLDSGLKQGQARVLRLGRTLHLVGLGEAGVFHASVSAIGRTEEDLQVAVRALAAQARSDLSKGITGPVQWGCVDGGDLDIESGYAAAFAEASRLPCEMLAHEQLLSVQKTPVASALPGLCATMGVRSAQATLLSRLSWWSESLVAPMAAVTAVVAVGLMVLGVLTQSQAVSEAQINRDQQKQVDALELRIASANKVEVESGLTSVADFARQLGDGAVYDPVTMLQLVRQAAGSDIRIQRVKLESQMDKKRSFRVDGVTERSGVAALSSFLAQTSASGWKAEPLDPAEQLPGAFSYRLTAKVSAPVPGDLL